MASPKVMFCTAFESSLIIKSPGNIPALYAGVPSIGEMTLIAPFSKLTSTPRPPNSPEECSSNKEKACLTSGASMFLNPLNNNIYENIKEFTKDEYLDVVIDFVSSKSTLELSTNILGKGGRLVTLGGSGDKFEIDSSKMLLKELEIIGSRYCTKQEVIDSLSLVSRGLIKPLVTEKFKPINADKLHDKIEKGDVIGRAGLIF